jgi:protease I
MTANLNSLKVAVLVTDGFEQSEMTQPRAALDAAGAKTVLVSLKPGEVRGWSGKDWGDPFPVDLRIEDAHARDFDALVLPGGVMNPDHLRTHDAAVAFVKAFVEAKKPIAAICHGPWTLINAGGVAGRRMTSWPSLEADLRNAGADWIDDQCVVDGNLVTSRKPDDLPAFCAHMVKLFAGAVEHA